MSRNWHLPFTKRATANSTSRISSRRFVMPFYRFRTPLLSEFDSSSCQFDSSFQEVDSSLREFVSSSCQFDLSFYEFDSSLNTPVRRRLSLCSSVVSLWHFIVSTSQRGYNSSCTTWSVTWFHAFIHAVFILNLLFTIKLKMCEW